MVDALVRSRDYLGADQYPAITFRLDKLTQTSKSTADVDGPDHPARRHPAGRASRRRSSATARPTTTPSRFEAGFDLTGSIDRTAFGSTGGLPDVGAVLPVQIRLLMSSQ